MQIVRQQVRNMQVINPNVPIDEGLLISNDGQQFRDSDFIAQHATLPDRQIIFRGGNAYKVYSEAVAGGLLECFIWASAGPQYNWHIALRWRVE